MSSGRSIPRLHLVTNDEVIGREGFARQAEEILHAGGDRLAFHVRARGASGRRLFELSSALAAAAAAAGAMLLVNDRLDVALAAGAAGGHLGAGGLPLPDARRLLGASRVLGVSVHEADAAVAALSEGADFVLAGTLFASASHPGRRGSGVEWLRRVPAGSGPLIGIGGVTLSRVPEVLEAGAHGVAVIREVWNAERPRDAALRLLDALHAGN